MTKDTKQMRGGETISPVITVKKIEQGKIEQGETLMVTRSAESMVTRFLLFLGQPDRR